MADKPEMPSKRKGGSPEASGEVPADQYERFVRAARELECDDDPAAFDRMFERVVPPKRKPEESATEDEAGEKRKRRPR